MKKFDIEDVLNQRRPVVHAMILVFSLAAVGFNVYANKGSGSWQSYLGGLVLIFTQIELFIFLARLVFKRFSSVMRFDGQAFFATVGRR